MATENSDNKWKFLAGKIIYTYIIICLVVTGTMEFYDFPETVWEWNVIIPTDELHHFSEG